MKRFPLSISACKSIFDWRPIWRLFSPLVILPMLCLFLAEFSPARAASFERLGVNEAGTIKKVALTNLTIGGPSRVVTAVRQGDNNLKLIVWNVTKAGNLKRKGDILAGAVSDLAITALSASRVVTAVRDSHGDLKVITFDITNNGELVRRGSAQAGSISRVSLQSLGPDRFLTAVRDSRQKLELIRWNVNTEGNITRNADTTAGKIGLLDIAGGPSHVTAVADSAKKLKLIHWWQSEAGFTRGGSASGAKIALVRIKGEGGLSGSWFTATTDPGPTGIRTGLLAGGRLLYGAGTLKVITWGMEKPNIFSDLVRTGEAEVTGNSGITNGLALAQIDPGRIFVTATEGVGTYRKLLEKNRGKPHLKLIAWKPRSNSIENLAEVTAAGDYRSVAITVVRKPLPLGTAHRLVTAMRDSRNNLKLVVWDFLPE